MAVKKIPMKYRVVEIKGNDKYPIPEAIGKFRAVPVCTDTLATKGLVQHIYQHNGSFGKAVYGCVLQEIVDCLVELISTGTPVKLDGLGTFRPSFDCKLAASAEDFTAQENIKGIHIRFLPEGVKDEQITSRQLLNKVALSKSELVMPDDGDEEQPEEP